MSQQNYTSFAVVGAGEIGIPIVQALLEKSVKVVIISRPGSSTASKLPSAAQIVSVDLLDESAVATALKEHQVEVVVSAIGGGALEHQTNIVNAAKAAGTVKLFAPSEFGVPSYGYTEGRLAVKSNLIDHLQSLGIGSASFYVGFFIEWTSWLANTQSGNFYIVGEGNTPGSFTSKSDIAGFLAHVLTTLAPSELHNSTFRIQGERSTLRQIASLYYPDKPIVQVSDNIPDSPFQTHLHKILERGAASTGYDVRVGGEGKDAAGSSNSLWEGHEWKGIKAGLGL